MNGLPFFVKWGKCTGDQWCPFGGLDLSQSYFDGREGVYIIWRPENMGVRVIRVGQGVIRDRLQEHQADSHIMRFDFPAGMLRVTWAEVDKQHRDEIEAYLFHKLQPAVGERCPNCPDQKVNLPWV